MSECRSRAILYRVLNAPGEWELAVVLDDEIASTYSLNCGSGMTPSDCDRGVALRAMGYQVARYQAWDWYEVYGGHDKPVELMARVHVVPVPERTSGA